MEHVIGQHEGALLRVLIATNNMAFVNDTKNTEVFVNDSIGFGDITWDEANFSWDNANGSWDTPKDVFINDTKNTEVFVNDTKNA